MEEVEVISSPILNQALVRFHHPREGATDADHDRYTEEVIARINAGGDAFFTASTWQGLRVMRISVCNWRTTVDDVNRALDAVAHALSRISQHSASDRQNKTATDSNQSHSATPK